MNIATSEFIRQVEGFCRYATQEYVGDGSTKAFVVTCVDLDAPDAPVRLVFGQGNRKLVEDVVRQMRNVDGLREMLIRTAREAGEIEKDRSAEIASLKSMLRKDYLMAGLVTSWTLCVIAFYVAGISDLITFVSNLLLCVWLHILIWHDVRHRRRRVRELESSAMQDLIAKVEGKLAKMESFFADLRRRMMEDDDDDDY